MLQTNTGRIVFVAIFLMIMWGSLLVFFWKNSEAIMNDPCSICAEKVGRNVMCFTQSTAPLSRTFYINGTIADGGPIHILNRSMNEKIYNVPKFNFTPA